MKYFSADELLLKRRMLLSILLLMYGYHIETTILQSLVKLAS